MLGSPPRWRNGKLRPSLTANRCRRYANAADELRARRAPVTMALSTGPEPHPPIVVAIPSAGAGSVAVCDQLRAVDKTRLARMMGVLSREDLRAVEEGVRAMLQL